MAVGILMILAGAIVCIIQLAAESFDEPMPPFESDEEFWKFHLELAGIADPTERRLFEYRKKKEMIERQKRKQNEK